MHTSAIAVPTLMDQIAMQYGVSDMTNFDTPTIQALPLGSIDQEFEDYTKAVSLKGTDMVKFWGVSNICNFYDLMLMLKSSVKSIRTPSPPFSASPSTISRSKRHQCHASESSRQLAKPARNGATGSIATFSKPCKFSNLVINVSG